MQIRIEVLGNKVGNGQSIQEVVDKALKKKGFENFTQFAKEVAKVRGTKPASETQGVSRLMLGDTSWIEPEKAKAYAQVLEIPEQELLKFSGAGKRLKGKPIIVDDNTDLTKVVNKLKHQRTITVEDLVKELLYLQHQ